MTREQELWWAVKIARDEAAKMENCAFWWERNQPQSTDTIELCYETAEMLRILANFYEFQINTGV